MGPGNETPVFAPPPPPVAREQSRTAATHDVGQHASAPEVSAARALTREISDRLQRAPTFSQLAPSTQAALRRDLACIQQAFSDPAPAAPRALETPQDLRRQMFGGGRAAPVQPPNPLEDQTTQPPGPKQAATASLAQRAGALVDEIDFPAFVAGLVHGTFDAIVDAAIRQMESFADLVSAVAKDVDTFTAENVSPNQARDWLLDKYPGDVEFVPGATEPRLRARSTPDETPRSPAWLGEYDLAGEELSEELLEEQLLPMARRRMGESRMQLLATMVLLGMNRIVVRDGSIRARVRFRAAAQDKAQVEYATSQDPGGSSTWGARGSSVYSSHSTMISTVGVNAQTDSALQAELFGEVHINFASETVPLDRFVDQARMTLLQRHARTSAWQQPGGQAAPASTAPTPAPAPSAPVASAPAPQPTRGTTPDS